jgi:outer membrane protein assembly factor BamB
VVHDGVVVVGSQGLTLTGLDARTGQKRWRWKTVDRDFTFTKRCSTPLPGISDGHVLFSSRAGELVALDLHRGTKRWSHLFSMSDAAAHDCRVHRFGDTVFITTGWQKSGAGYLEDLGSRVSAFNAQSGALRWHRHLRGEIGRIGVAENVFVLTAHRTMQALLALDRRTGKELWSIPLARAGLRYQWLDSIRGGKIIVCSDTRGARVFDASTGREVKGANRYCGRLVGGVVVRYEASRARLTVRRAGTGTLLWKRDNTYALLSGYSVADGVIYLGLGNRILALDLQNGCTLWQFRLPQSKSREHRYLTTIPVPGYGALYFGTNDNSVWAIR